MGYVMISTNHNKVFEIIFYLDFGVEPIFSSSIKKEELKIKSHVTTVIRNMWHVLESRSLI